MARYKTNDILVYTFTFMATNASLIYSSAYICVIVPDKDNVKEYGVSLCKEQYPESEGFTDHKATYYSSAIGDIIKAARGLIKDTEKK